MATVRPRSIPMETDAEVVKAAVRLFGVRLVNVIASGSWELTPIESGSPTHRPDMTAIRSLRHALDVARLLLDVEAQETVRAWFAGKNPLLDDRAPAVVIAANPERVRFAARDLLAHG